MFRPMLAATVENRSQLSFPYLASPKLDGIRCIVLNHQVLSRSLKPIRNRHIADKLAHLPDMDGELIVGAPNEGDVFNRTTRGVMSADGQPDFKYHVFDTLQDLSAPFHKRLAAVPISAYIERVGHPLISSMSALDEYEADVLARGYEGVMLRGINAGYKCGRATARENSLWKLKQFMDGEILVTGVLEGMTNINAPTKDALGETTRSTHQDGMLPNNKVGTIVGVDIKTRQQLEISPGKMTHDARAFFWKYPDKIVGQIVKYKCFGYGSINVARFATFQGFRDPTDM